MIEVVIHWPAPAIAHRLAAGILAVAALAAGSASWRSATRRTFPTPIRSWNARRFKLAEGFEVNLFAADPLLAKPIQMNFDADGRLWVASSEIYPHIKPGQKANDKILVLEDTDGDGRADKTTVFADGLLIPTGIEPGDGGVYVANSTEILLHFKDTDGDGKADTRRVMLSGFGTEDTHHILHTLRWGPDGMLYFNQSVYIHSHIETPTRRAAADRRRHLAVPSRNYGAGRLRPRLVESLGPCTSNAGASRSSPTAPAARASLYVFPGATFDPSPGASRFCPGSTRAAPSIAAWRSSAAGICPTSGRASLITNDFRAHRVCRFVLSEDGSGFSSREQTELIKTTHPAFRPIDVKMGPDGAIYIADWYNPIIQHGEVDFRDPRRDHTHGRIWRVTAKGRPLVARPKLVDATSAALLAQLKSPEGWTRQFAKRVIKQRGPDIAADLAAWVVDLARADPQYEHHLLEALWSYQSLSVVEPQLLDRLLHAQDPHARAAAVRVLGAWQARLGDPLEQLAALVGDDFPCVRLEAVRGAGRAGHCRSRAGGHAGD